MSNYVIRGTVVEGSGAIHPKTDRFRSAASSIIDRLEKNYGQQLFGSFMLVDLVTPGYPGGRVAATAINIVGIPADKIVGVLIYDNSSANMIGRVNESESTYPFSRSRVTRVDFEPCTSDFNIVNQSHSLMYSAPGPLTINSIVHYDLDSQRFWRVAGVLPGKGLLIESPNPVDPTIMDTIETWKGRLYPVLY